MLYSTAATLLGGYEMQDVAFPSQLEVRVNQEEVKSNYKGLKNKPGTTKPADLTPFVRKMPGYANNLSITYALTTKVVHSAIFYLAYANDVQKFSYVVNLVRKNSTRALTDSITRTGKRYTKQQVLAESKSLDQ